MLRLLERFAIVVDRFWRQCSVGSASWEGAAASGADTDAGRAVRLISPPPHNASASLDNKRTQAHNAPRSASSRLSVRKPVYARSEVLKTQCPSVCFVWTYLFVAMENKLYSVENSEDFIIEEDEEQIEDNHSE